MPAVVSLRPPGAAATAPAPVAVPQPPSVAEQPPAVVSPVSVPPPVASLVIAAPPTAGFGSDTDSYEEHGVTPPSSPRIEDNDAPVGQKRALGQSEDAGKRVRLGGDARPAAQTVPGNYYPPRPAHVAPPQPPVQTASERQRAVDALAFQRMMPPPAYPGAFGDWWTIAQPLSGEVYYYNAKTGQTSPVWPPNGCGPFGRPE